MKKLILCFLIIVLPIFAEEIGIGMVDSVDGDELILVDGLKIHVPNLSQGRYIDNNNVAIPPSEVTFPFTASLVMDDRLLSPMRDQHILVKIHVFYRLVNGILVPINR